MAKVVLKIYPPISYKISSTKKVGALVLEEKMPKVKVGDVNMYYEIHGEGVPLLLIMGHSGTTAL